jgi:glycosyltransferase involved in cell wall biosynthesis
MKLLVFAHVPPPYHGQSAAVKLMLEHFGGDRRQKKFRRRPPGRYGIECYHVNARFSKTLEDVGELQAGKVLMVLFYCLQAIWCRFRYGVKTLYYVPAPGKAVALYRDWLVMFFCRPFFDKIIFHWHGGGLAKWLETVAQTRTRGITYYLMRDADLSLVLTEFGRGDAEKLLPKRVAVIPSGIPDPCPRFEETLLMRRRARAAVFKKILSGGFTYENEMDRTVSVLFIAHCLREKGVFDVVEAIALANETLTAENSPLRFRLTIVGAFASHIDERALKEFIRQRKAESAINILGFVPDERKYQELRNADIFCFPSYYPAEGQPASLMEALAFGLPIITTRWRAIPAVLPENYPGLVDIKSPAQIAEKLRQICASDVAPALRETFLKRYTLEQHLNNITRAMHSVDNA